MKSTKIKKYTTELEEAKMEPFRAKMMGLQAARMMMRVSLFSVPWQQQQVPLDWHPCHKVQQEERVCDAPNPCQVYLTYGMPGLEILVQSVKLLNPCLELTIERAMHQFHKSAIRNLAAKGLNALVYTYIHTQSNRKGRVGDVASNWAPAQNRNPNSVASDN